MGIEGIDELKPGNETPVPVPNRFAEAFNLREVVFQLAGAASVCWDQIEKAGVFQSEDAKEFCEEALRRIAELEPIYHDDETLLKVYHTLRKANIEPAEAQALISDMQNKGIYFREMKS